MLILPRYNDFRLFGSLDITIPRYNDLIPLLPWHIVISGFHYVYLYLLALTEFLKNLFIRE